jgi:hypothetical protein
LFTKEGLQLRVQDGSGAAGREWPAHSRSSAVTGVVEQTLSNWIKAYKAGKLMSNGRGSKLTAEQIEIRQL